LSIALSIAEPNAPNAKPDVVSLDQSVPSKVRDGDKQLDYEAVKKALEVKGCSTAKAAASTIDQPPAAKPMPIPNQ
jgi:hypothetical protein